MSGGQGAARPRPPRGQALTIAVAERLLAGDSQQQAADTIGVARSTVYRRAADPEFRRLLVDLRTERLARVADALGAASTAAVGVLREILEDSEQPASARVRAAGLVLRLGERLREEADVHARLLALEAAERDRSGLRVVR